MAAVVAPAAPKAGVVVPQRPRSPVHDGVPSEAPEAQQCSTGRRQLDPEHTRSLLVILHGKRVEDELVRDALTSLKAQGHRITVRVTFDRGDVEAFVAEVVRLNAGSGAPRYQTIVAGGGDGTLNEVVCALLTHRDAIQRQGLAVALLPLGTANDFACVTGISVDPLVALQTALDPSNIHLIDVATVNGRPFVNIAVVGRFAAFTPAELASQSKWKRLFGPAAIAVQVFKRVFKPKALQPFKQATITFCHEPAAGPASSSSSMNGIGNGHAPSSSGSSTTMTADLLMLAVGNSRQMGGSLNVCPNALLDDGLLDFTLLTGDSLATQAAELLGALASGDADDVPCDSGICQLKASWLRVDSTQTLAAAEAAAAAAEAAGDEVEVDLLPINRDGEPEEPASSLLFEVLPRVLPMHLPDDRMLQSSSIAAVDADRASSASSELGSDAPVIRGNIHSSGGGGLASSSATDHHQQQQRQQGSSKKQHRRKKLRKRTLLKMMSAAQPEGLAVRQRQQMAALCRKLSNWGLVLLVGGVVGWAVRARRERREQHQQEHWQQQQQQQQRGRGRNKGRTKVLAYDL